jgi:hypothetical protein
MQISCYSWWLLPLRHILAVVDHWAPCWWLLGGSDQVYCEGYCAHPTRDHEGTLVECSRLVGVLLVDWLLVALHIKGQARIAFLAREAITKRLASTKDVGHLASNQTSGINLYFFLLPRWFALLHSCSTLLYLSLCNGCLCSVVVAL